MDDTSGLVTVEEMKQYLRVDSSEEDGLIADLIRAAVKQCMDILRTEDPEVLRACDQGKVAVMYSTAYFFEHRELADHLALDLTLRALLFGCREAAF